MFSIFNRKKSLPPVGPIVSDTWPLQVGQRHSQSGGVVERIYAADSNFAIFNAALENGRRTLGYINKITASSAIEPHIARFASLGAQLMKCVPEPEKDQVSAQLANALAMAFRVPDKPPSLDVFDDVSKHIAHYANANARLFYVGGAVGSGVFIVFVALLERKLQMLLTDYPADMLLGVCFGVTGAFCSVIRRSGNLKLDYYATRRFHIFQGATRVFLGAIFGVLALLAIDSGVLLSVAKENRKLAFLMAVAAGFSESLVPETLRRLSSSKDEQ